MYALLPLLVLTAAPRIAVLDIKPRVGVTAELASGITDDVVIEVRRRVPGATVISSEEIRSMAGFETQKQNMGCQVATCLAEIGGALGVDSLVLGTLGRFGSTYLLSLQLVDTHGAKVRRQASLKLHGKGDDELLEAVSKAVEQLFPNQPPPVVAPPVATVAPPGPAAVPAAVPAAALAAPVATEVVVEQPKKSHALQWGLIGAGGAAAVVAAIGGVAVLNYTATNDAVTKGTQPAPANLAGQRSNAEGWGTAGLVLAGVAAACAVGTVVTW